MEGTMSDQPKKQSDTGLRIEDLPPKAAKPEEDEATKGGYSKISSGLSGIGILHDTLPQMTDDGSGNETVDGT
jgi:hypothetical protein